MNKNQIRQYKNSFELLFRIFDGLVIFGALALAAHLRGYHLDPYYVNAGLLATTFFWISAETFDLYRRWSSIAFIEQVMAAVGTWMTSVITLLIVAYFTQVTGYYSRIIMALWVSFGLIALLFWRLCFRKLLDALRSSGFNTKSAIIVTVNDSAVSLAREFETNRRHGIQLIGYYDDRSPDRIKQKVEIKGNVNDAIELARSGQVDMVYISLPLNAEERTIQMLKRLADTTATVLIVPNFFVYDLLHARWQQVGHSMTLSIFDTPTRGISGGLKRIEDIVLSSLMLLILWLPMTLIAVLIKAIDKGPVFFTQYRYGLAGAKFKVYKFRTMRAAEDGKVVKQATKNDVRVSQLGSFLRKTSLDELPQLINVLMGDMSLVGPRPHAVAHNEEYRNMIHGYMLRHKVKPGLTGWAQVHGWRGETDKLEKMENRVKYDLEYIQNWSLLLDLKIILLTVWRAKTIHREAY
jgi:putative colanic acid biosynthesis UDP-glucose lipid carrier transferase